MKITLVCEHNPGMDTPEGRAAYPEGMAECLAGIFSEGNEVTLLRAGEDGAPGLTDEILGGTDVLVWWAHWYHHCIPDALADKIAARVQCGMGALFLHSAHMAKPFRRLLGTSCTLTWREAGERERLWCTDPAHPIAAGLPGYIDIPHEEMYGEPFDIPAPDELVYLGWFEGGEALRAGCVFRRGRGKLFYFNPGHETYATYKIEEVRRLLQQACAYVAPAAGVLPELACVHREKFIGK